MMPQEMHEQMLRTLLAPIAGLLDDSSVSEILINGYERIYCERAGTLHRTQLCFANEAALLSALRNVAQLSGRPLDAHHPLLEARLPDGSRVQAAIAPASPEGPTVSIRRFPPAALTLPMLLRQGAVSTEMVACLERAMLAKRNILVAGGTGTGKTSLLNALSALIPRSERIVVLEDSRELQLQQEHVVHLEAQPGDARGAGQVTMRELLRATLRMRPDRIVLGEVRGAEAFELIAATTSGHGGCMSTLHASHPEDTLARLETLASMSDVRMPLSALREQIASGIDVIVQVRRDRDGARRIGELCEVHGLLPSGRYDLRPMQVQQPSSQGVAQ